MLHETGISQQVIVEELLVTFSNFGISFSARSVTSANFPADVSIPINKASTWVSAPLSPGTMRKTRPGTRSYIYKSGNGLGLKWKSRHLYKR